MHRQAEAPVFGGDMGYVGPEAHFSQNVPRTGDSGTYVPKGILDAGEADGVALEYYKSYDTRAFPGFGGGAFVRNSGPTACAHSGFDLCFCCMWRPQFILSRKRSL